MLATTERGVCYLGFVDEDKEELLEQLKAEWCNATFVQNASTIQPKIQKIFYPSLAPSRPITLLVKGTNFQINVWRALLTIPSGNLVSYQDIAQHIGKPKASRAVGTAIAKNSIGYLIPCHRVITNTGALKNYRWGTARKKALIGWEAGKRALEIAENL
nr:methylated-DNA--[protein]-cysteine S-methyltransferase [Halodesulfovibrio sp. MK-HDV]